MTIGLEMHEDVAVFTWPPGYDGVVDEFDELLDRRDTGRLSRARYRKALGELVERNPWFIDGHAHLGYAAYERGEFESALDACERGYSLGLQAMPAGFEQFIEWGFLENRPFLRAAHGVVLCRLRLGQRAEAVSVMERMLAWNPSDNQGVRYIIGSEYLRAGREDEAASFFETEAEQYPPYRYELALLLLRRGEHAAAATGLRHGFVENGYIMEILCGNPDPQAIGIWHGGGYSLPQTAKDYVADYGKLWHDTPEAVRFVRWLHTHPRVMSERAAILEWREALLWEHDAAERARLLDAGEAACAEIDDRLSREIVAARRDREGRMVRPWLHLEPDGF